MRSVERYLPVLLLAAGCAARRSSPPDPATLETRLRDDPSSYVTRLQLAAAYARDGNAARGIPLLEPIVRDDSTDAVAALYLGLGLEAAERFGEAHRLYSRVLDRPAPGPLKRRIRQRLDLLARLELENAVRASLRQEDSLATGPTGARTVGVFPFIVSGDSALRPLGRALAELLTTDLGQTSRLRVVERVRVQLLLDEMQLGTSRYANPATAARTGRIVGAANLVQGRIDGSESDLAVQAVVVATASPEATTDPANERGPIGRLIDMQKQIAFAVDDRLGVQLTAAERQRVNRRPTENVQALLAFGFGLEASDAGRYAEAARYFDRARQLDPGFEEAGRYSEETRNEAAAATVTTQQLARQIEDAFDTGLTSFQRDRLGLEVIRTAVPAPLVRDASVEVVGAEGVGRGTVIDIIIRRPGGSQ